MGPGAVFRVIVRGNQLGARMCFPKALCALCVRTYVYVCVCSGRTDILPLLPSPQAEDVVPLCRAGPFCLGEEFNSLLA